MFRIQAFIIIIIVLLLVACSAEIDPVDVTRIVEEADEVTRPDEVTVEVTRRVEVAVEATDTLRDLFFRYDEIVVTRIVETEIQRDLGQAVVSVLENEVEGVEQINLIRWSKGQLEIELVTAIAAGDDQPDVSWDVVTALAGHFAPLTAGQRLDLSGSDKFVLVLTTKSTVGEHEYRSETDFDTFVQLNDRAMSFDEWVEAAQAAFR